MAKIDVIKEEINYLKLWLGIAVVTDISLVSWWTTHGADAGNMLKGVALAALASIAGFAWSVHRRIANRIKDLEHL